jgi:hypothetical protein
MVLGEIAGAGLPANCPKGIAMAIHVDWPVA